ncbi:MAG TPA: delta-60 repeat domain-containing protein [Terrimicrobiaceae bacterium]|nr:delta-60 repeat domain-containing protein [Terrimicrobiaceae bacterium]
MKNFLLVLAVSAVSAFGQSEVAVSSAFGGGQGVDGTIYALAAQPDGKIILGGRFGSVNGIPRNNIARLNADGTLDRTFVDNLDMGVNGQINAIAIQPDGGIVIGGTFTQAGRVELMNLAKYKADGSIDKNFGGASGSSVGANGSVLALAVQADGKVVVGGNFSTIFGQPRRGIARITVDGSLDGPVVPANALSGDVKAIAVPADGSAVAGGAFVVQNQPSLNLLQIAAP